MILSGFGGDFLGLKPGSTHWHARNGGQVYLTSLGFNPHPQHGNNNLARHACKGYTSTRVSGTARWRTQDSQWMAAATANLKQLFNSPQKKWHAVFSTFHFTHTNMCMSITYTHVIGIIVSKFFCIGYSIFISLTLFKIGCFFVSLLAVKKDKV